MNPYDGYQLYRVQRAKTRAQPRVARQPGQPTAASGTDQRERG